MGEKVGKDRRDGKDGKEVRKRVDGKRDQTNAVQHSY
jgi:hypothetical protein